MAEDEGEQIMLPKPSDASNDEIKVEQRRNEPSGLKISNFARKKKTSGADDDDDDGDQIVVIPTTSNDQDEEAYELKIPNFARKKRNSAPAVQHVGIDCLELDYKATKEFMRSVSGLGMEDPVFGLSNHSFSRNAQRKTPFVNFFDDMKITDIAEDMQDEISVCSDPTASFHQRLPALDTISSKRRYEALAKEVKAAKKKQVETTFSKRLLRPNAHRNGHSSFVPPPSVLEFENSRKEETYIETSMAVMNMSLVQSENELTSPAPAPVPIVVENKPKPRPKGRNSGKEKSGTSNKTRKPHQKQHRHNNSSDFSSGSHRLHQSCYIPEDGDGELQIDEVFSGRKSRSKLVNDVSMLYASDSRLTVNAAAENGRRKQKPDDRKKSKSPQPNKSKSPPGRKGSRSKQRNHQSDNFLSDSKCFVIERPHESLRSDNLMLGDNGNNNGDGEIQLEDLVKADKAEKHQRNKNRNRVSKLYASESNLLSSGAKPRNRPYQPSSKLSLSQIIPEKDLNNSEVICDLSKASKMSGITLDKALRPRKSTNGSREKRAMVAEALKQSTLEEFEQSLSVMELAHASAELDCSIETSDDSTPLSNASNQHEEKANKTRSKSPSGRQERKDGDGTKKKRPSRDSTIKNEEREHSRRKNRSQIRSCSREHSKRGRRTSSKNASPTELLQYHLDQTQGGGESKVDKSRPRCHSLDSRSEHASKHAEAERRSRKASKTRSEGSAGAVEHFTGKSRSKKESSKKMMESGNMSMGTSNSAVQRAKDIRSSFRRHKDNSRAPVGA